MKDFELEHLVGKARDAQRGGHDAWRVMSTGERLAVALVLDRPDWIKEAGYTLAEAVHRVGEVWCELLLAAQRQLEAEAEADGEEPQPQPPPPRG